MLVNRRFTEVYKRWVLTVIDIVCSTVDLDNPLILITVQIIRMIRLWTAIIIIIKIFLL